MYLKTLFEETNRKVQTHNTFLQISAYGIPALQTIVALVLRLVDADELLGEDEKVEKMNLKISKVLFFHRNVLRWKSI